MHSVPLTTARDGITRLRVKGSPSPDTLYDLVNGYITQAGSIKPRPGTVTDIALPADTVGLTAHNCKFYVFSHTPKVTSNPDKYVVATLRHPEDDTIKLAQIHFAAPFMGFLYVAAEFEDGNIWHYWLEELDAWAGSSAYDLGDRVFPTVENGYAYKAHRLGSPYQVWAPNVQRALNDIVEPTVYNGYKYTVIAVTGTNPSSGATEPSWPEESGGQVIEYSHSSASITLTSSAAYPDPDVGSIPDRYSNLSGGFLTKYLITV